MNLEELQKNNFVKRKITLFLLGLELNSNSIKYLLIDNGFDVGTALIDTIKTKYF